MIYRRKVEVPEVRRHEIMQHLLSTPARHSQRTIFLSASGKDKALHAWG